MGGDRFGGTEEREHGALVLCARFFHKGATAGDEAKAVDGGKGACSGVGGEFAKRKAGSGGGDKIRASFVEDLPEG